MNSSFYFQLFVSNDCENTVKKKSNSQNEKSVFEINIIFNQHKSDDYKQQTKYGKA